MLNKKPKTLIIKKLGTCDYQKVWQQMQEFTAKRDENTPDEVWLLEHPHVFTQGKSGKPEHVLDPGNVPIIQTDRGGQITYHGPGQLIIYPLFDIRRAKIGVKKFVNLLEKTVIDTLAEYGIEATTREDAPGVYVSSNGAKICSLGLRVHRGCTYHGLALNVTTDLSYFKRINPCGYKNLAMTKISDFVSVSNVAREELERKICTHLTKHFEYQAAINADLSVNVTNSQNLTSHIRKPEWIRSKLLSPDEIAKVKKMLRGGRLATVCEEAACPNRAECFGRGTATFIIMGNICTRNCRFCNVQHGRPQPLDATEPERLAKTIAEMGLKYVVITSVCRDDLEDEGAAHFVACIKAIRKQNPEIKIEILVPDFRKHMEKALNILAEAPVEVFAHNLETIPRLYQTITPARNYQLSLQLLKEHKNRHPNIPTKSGIMVGLGETLEEVIEVMRDLRKHDVDRLTIGQYLQPQLSNAPVARYVTPEEFANMAKIAKEMGFTHVASGPMVRSSYYADLA